MTLSPGASVEVTIESLGARGDGIAYAEGARLFVPYSVPGDRLVVRIESAAKDGLRAGMTQRIVDGPGRGRPLCRHFGECGGCVAQHLDEPAYTGWKETVVREALAHRELDPAVAAPLHRIAPGTRRRARLKARHLPGGAALGFFAPASHRIVDLAECPILVPSLATRLPSLRAGLAGLLAAGTTAELAMTAAETGVDLVLGSSRAPGRSLLSRIAALAETADLARISVRRAGGERGAAEPPEPVARRRPVQVRFGGVAVDVPPDAFLQPTEEGERFLAAAVLEAVSSARRVADLYAGCGAFALRLLETGSRVHAADSAADHVAALEGAARRSGLGAQLDAETRDLGRRPLIGDELAGLDAVVLDPPRPGAPQQAKALADSSVPTVVYVSCNPASFARDARVLTNGGYVLETVRPLDQFVFSPHIELVAVFRKQRTRRR